MEVGASERAMNCDKVGWTLAGQNEAGADDRKLRATQRSREVRSRH